MSYPDEFYPVEEQSADVLVPSSLRVFLKSERLARGWSMDRLAMEAGLSNKSLISRIESGDLRNPRIGTLEKIAGVLDIPVAMLSQMCQYPAAAMPDAVRELLDRSMNEENFVELPFAALTNKLHNSQARICEAMEFLKHEDPVIRHMAAPRLVEYLVFHRELVKKMEQEAKYAVEQCLKAAQSKETVDYAQESMQSALELLLQAA